MVNPKIQICVNRCRDKSCEQSPKGTVSVCPYGIFFYNDGRQVIKREPHVSVQNLSSNLRHVVNPILNSIVENVNKLDHDLSVRSIDPAHVPSKILALTVILDHFIKMIAGVSQFYPVELEGSETTKSDSILNIVIRYFKVYSILESADRAENLTLNTD